MLWLERACATERAAVVQDYFILVDVFWSALGWYTQEWSLLEQYIAVVARKTADCFETLRHARCVCVDEETLSVQWLQLEQRNPRRRYDTRL